jgi:2-(1,2-epoxy-1,2-dihydrophenyl)acetyl-CoA isomerase
MGDVTVEVGSDHVAIVEFHRPPENYFDVALIRELADAFESLQRDGSCRAIVLCSEGKHFCAGASFKAPRSERGEATAVRSNTENAGHLYVEAVRLFAAELPVVVAVQGGAIGGGLGVALVGDFRVACPEARFAANFSRLGFHHGFGLSVTLPALVGQQRAMDMLYTGRRVGGEEALTMGMCDRLVPLAQLRDTAHELAADIAASAPLAVRSIRATLRSDLAARVKVAVDREEAEQGRLRKTADFAEGVRATAERRTPDFHGR